MKCSGKGFNTCDNGKWVYRDCGPATACRQWQGTLFCDYEKNASAPKCSGEGQFRCRGSKFDQCDHGVWVSRDCGPGTSCKMNGAMAQCV
jgi:hypothetical protein